MTTLEDQLSAALAQASSHLSLPVTTATTAWNRGRRRRHQAQAVGAGLGVAALGASGMALHNAPSRPGVDTVLSAPLASLGSAPTPPSPSPSTGPEPDHSASTTEPVDPRLAAVGLPDPAPGFPLRRDPDRGDGSFLLGVTPPVVSGQLSTPTDHEAIVEVTRAPNNPIAYPVIGTVTVRGVPAKVVQVSEHQIGVQAVKDDFFLQAYGDNSAAGAPVTVDQLVALLDALTGV